MGAHDAYIRHWLVKGYDCWYVQCFDWCVGYAYSTMPWLVNISSVLWLHERSKSRLQCHQWPAGYGGELRLLRWAGYTLFILLWYMHPMDGICSTYSGFVAQILCGMSIFHCSSWDVPHGKLLLAKKNAVICSQIRENREDSAAHKVDAILCLYYACAVHVVVCVLCGVWWFCSCFWLPQILLHCTPSCESPCVCVCSLFWS